MMLRSLLQNYDEVQERDSVMLRAFQNGEPLSRAFHPQQEAKLNDSKLCQ